MSGAAENEPIRVDDHLHCRARIAKLEREKARLEAEIQDWKDSMAHAKDEQSGHDEEHCTCVGLLRREIERLDELKSRFHSWFVEENKKRNNLEARVERLTKALDVAYGVVCGRCPAEWEGGNIQDLIKSAISGQGEEKREGRDG